MEDKMKEIFEWQCCVEGSVPVGTAPVCKQHALFRTNGHPYSVQTRDKDVSEPHDSVL